MTCACGYDKNLGDISSWITSSWDPLTNSRTILATKESKSIVGIKGYLVNTFLLSISAIFSFDQVCSF